MPIYNNSPTFTYIRVDGASVGYNKEVYMVARMYTNQKYIYWDFNTPYQFVTSNVRLEVSSTRFLVLINDKGVHTEVPNDEILISYDANSDEAIKERIYGIYEKNKEYDEKFVAVEIDIDGIKSIVGDSEDDEGTLVSRMSKIEQRADKIELSVEEVEKDLKLSEEMMKLREDVTSAFLTLSSNLGTFKSKTTGWFKDNQVSAEEKVEIQASKDVMNTSKTELYTEIDKVLALDSVQEDDVTVTGINVGKTSLDTAHSNLMSILDTAISDSIIVPSERTIIINCFAQYTLKINELKNVIDDAILLGAGGKIVEELARIRIESDEINLKVEKNTQKMTRNLLPNTNFASGQGKSHEWQTWFSSGDSSLYLHQHAGFPTGEGIGVQSRKPNAVGEMQSKTIRVSKGDVFTVSADVLVERNVSRGRVVFREFYNGGWENTGTFELSTNTSGRKSFTHTIQREDAKELMIIFVNSGSISDGSSYTVFFVNRVQLEKGDEATSWDLSSADHLESKFSEIKITADGIQSQVTAQSSQIGTLNSKIDQTASSIRAEVSVVDGKVGNALSQIQVQAGQIASKVDVNGVKSTIEQNPESVRIGFSGINDSIDFDWQGIKVWHPNGKHTRISSDGIKMVSNGNGSTVGDYHYLTHVVSFKTTNDTASLVWVQLPDEFKGKNFSAYATLSDTWEGSWDWGEPWVLQRMVAFVKEYDRPNGRVGVQGYRTDKNYKTGAHRHETIAGMLIVIA